MSNRLTLSRTTPRRDPREWLQAPARPHGLTAAVRWLHDLAAPSSDDMPSSVRRDLGLPEQPTPSVPLAYEIERSRVRV